MNTITIAGVELKIEDAQKSIKIQPVKVKRFGEKRHDQLFDSPPMTFCYLMFKYGDRDVNHFELQKEDLLKFLNENYSDLKTLSQRTDYTSFVVNFLIDTKFDNDSDLGKYLYLEPDLMKLLSTLNLTVEISLVPYYY